MTAQNKQIIERPLPELQKSFKAEFVDNKLMTATVDQEELTARKYKARIGNVHIADPSVEVSGSSPYSIKITDFSGTWLFEYPRK
jgi:hypothetical protein